MHSGKNVHSCPYCNRFFAHKHVFDSHLRTHTGERPFSCSRCGRAFSDRSNCSSHQVSTLKLLFFVTDRH